jgi:hypothetical protein
MEKSKNSVSLFVIPHRQNPLEPTAQIVAPKLSAILRSCASHLRRCLRLLQKCCGLKSCVAAKRVLQGMDDIYRTINRDFVLETSQMSFLLSAPADRVAH